MEWIRLTPERAQALYGIPRELANVTENLFFGMPIELPREYDVERPLLALIPYKESDDIVTLHIKTIHPETWEYHGMLPNPLTVDIGGYLNLDYTGLKDLIAVLQSCRERLFEKSNVTEQAFKKIEDSKLADFRLHPEWFPKTMQEHYLQVYDPLQRREDASVISILTLGKSIGFTTMNFNLIQFPSHDLQDPDFKPLDQGKSRIDLDNNSMQELVVLLRNFSVVLKGI